APGVSRYRRCEDRRASDGVSVPAGIRRRGRRHLLLSRAKRGSRCGSRPADDPRFRRSGTRLPNPPARVASESIIARNPPAHGVPAEFRAWSASCLATPQRPASEDFILGQPQLAVDQSKLVHWKTDGLNSAHGYGARAVEQRHVGCEMPCGLQSHFFHGGAERTMKLQQAIALAQQDQRPPALTAAERRGAIETREEMESHRERMHRNGLRSTHRGKDEFGSQSPVVVHMLKRDMQTFRLEQRSPETVFADKPFPEFPQTSG